MFKKVLLILTAAACLIGCTGRSNVLKVGTSSDNPPFEYIDANGELQGLDVDLAKMIAAQMGMEIEFVDMDFNSLIPALMANKVDVAIAGISVTNDRNRNIDFSRRYYVASQSVLVRNDSHIRIGKPEDLRNYIMGCQSGTTGQSYLKSFFIDNNLVPEANIRNYVTNVQMVLDLMNGNIDVAILDDSVAEAFSKIKPVKRVYLIDTGENYAVAFPKRSRNKDAIKAALEVVLNSTEWQDTLEKHLF